MSEPLDLDLFECDLGFDLAELGADHSECGWAERVAALIAECRTLRTRLAAVSEELDRPTALCLVGALRDRDYSSRVIANLEAAK